MKRYLRSLTMIFAGSVLAFQGVATAQRAGNDTDTPEVTWKAAPGQIAESSPSAGAQIAKDARTAKLRAALTGELPVAPIGRATHVINYSDGAKLAIAGDDLMSDSVAVAVKNADGSVSIRVGHSTDAKTQPEVK